MRSLLGRVSALWVLFLLVIAAIVLAASAGQPASPSAKSAPARKASTAKHATTKTDQRVLASKFGDLPLSFEPNVGQAPRSVDFVSHAANETILLAANQATVVSASQTQASADPFLSKLTPSQLKRFEQRKIYHSPRFRHPAKTAKASLAFDGANSQAKAQALNTLPGTVSYFLGKDPSKWHSGVPTYGRVRYHDIYPGIDLVYYGNRRQLEFDLVVSPGADPKKIVLNVGQDQRPAKLSDGSLAIGPGGNGIVLHRPAIYQSKDGKRVSVEGGFALQPNGRISIALGNYDKSKPLVIDPVLAYSTYLTASGGGADTDAIAVDANGDTFIASTTFSSSFPIVNGYQTTAAAAYNGIVAVSELNPAGTALLYSTYLGGSSGDYAMGIAVDGSGGAYVSGYTFSTDFPTLNAFQTSNNDASTSNAFVARIDTTQTGTASLIYSTYLGGGGNASNAYGGDASTAIATDGTGLAYVTGQTVSDSSVTPFPTTSTAYQSSLGGDNGNAFLSVLDTNQSGSASLVYSTYLGGDASGSIGDVGLGVAADPSGNAYIVGQTSSDSSGPFPTTATAYQPALNSSDGNAFLVEIATTQSGSPSLIYSTYFGGSTTNPLGDEAGAVALDSSGKVYVVGDATSSDFPVTSGVLQTTNSTNGDAFVAKWDLTQSGASALLYSTLLGGTNGPSGDVGRSIAVDGSGDAYLSGSASSTDFPTTSGAYQTSNLNTNYTAFVSELNPSATALLYSSYLGGSCAEVGVGIAIDSLGNPYVGGYTCSSDFPTYPSGVFQTTFEASQSGFVTKFALNANPGIVASESPQPNGSGWNNSAVTVSFTCIPGAAPLSSCTSPDTVSTEGASQMVTGTAEDTTSNTASTTVTVNLDLTAPSLSVTTPSSSSVTVSTPYIVISGSISDSLSGVGQVLCNRAPANVTGTSFSCTVPLRSASNIVTVTGFDVAGNFTSTTVSATVSISTPTSLSVAPPSPNMTVGGIQAFTAVDQNGVVRPDATWSISDTTVASFETRNPNTLVGNAAGTATVTATIGSITGTTTVTVLSSTPSLGTALWSAPAISGYVTQRIVQAVPTVSGPNLYAVDTDSSGDVLVRAFQSDGGQLWQSGLSSLFSSSNSYLFYSSNTGVQAVGDNAGGVLVLATPQAAQAIFAGGTNSITDLNPVTGQQNWQYTTSGAINPHIAVGTDGTVYAVETDFGYGGASSGYGGYSGSAYLDAISSTGTLTAQTTLPTTSISVPSSSCNETGVGPTEMYPGVYGSPMVTEDGSVYLETQAGSLVIDFESGCDWVPTGTWTVSLLEIPTGGTASFQTMDSTSGALNYFPPTSVGDVIPDGNGGQLVSWYATGATAQPLVVADVTASGTTQATVSAVTPAVCNYSDGYNCTNDGSMVLGDNNTLFATDGANVASLALPSFSTNWTYTSTGGTLSFVASANGGAITINDSSQGVIQLTSSGTAGTPVSSLNGLLPFDLGSTVLSVSGGPNLGIWGSASGGSPSFYASLFLNAGPSPFPAPQADATNSRSGSQVPTHIGISLGPLHLDTGGQMLQANGEPAGGPHSWGYNRFVTWTVLNSKNHAITNGVMTAAEEITLEGYSPAPPIENVAHRPVPVGSDGTFPDTWAFFYETAPGPVSGDYILNKQVLNIVTTKGKYKGSYPALRTTCINFQYNDVTYKDETDDPNTNCQ